MTTKSTSKMTTPNRRISISAYDYNQKMDKIISEANEKGWGVDQTLIALLDEASKYHILDFTLKGKSTITTKSKKVAKMHSNIKNVITKKCNKCDGLGTTPNHEYECMECNGTGHKSGHRKGIKVRKITK